MPLIMLTTALASFSQPIDVHTTPFDLLWAIPICICIAMVYKAVKLEHFETRHYIREVALLAATLIGFLILSALILLIIAKLVGQL